MGMTTIVPVSGRTASGQKLALGGVFRSIFGLFRRHALRLVPVAVVLALAAAGIEVAIAERLEEPWDSLIVTFLDTMVTVIVAGIAKELVRRDHEGEPLPSLRELRVAVTPVLWPLALVGALQSLLIVVGLLLLIIPGFIVMARLAPASAVVVAERTKVRGAVRRSNALVKGNRGRVMVVMLTMTFGGPVVVFVLALILGLFGVELDEHLATVFGEGIDLPLEAVAAPVLYYALDGGTRAPDDPRHRRRPACSAAASSANSSTGRRPSAAWPTPSRASPRSSAPARRPSSPTSTIPRASPRRWTGSTRCSSSRRWTPTSPSARATRSRPRRPRACAAWSSSTAPCTTTATRSPDQHKAALKALKDSGMQWALLSPNSVMETSFLSQAPAVQWTNALWGCAATARSGTSRSTTWYGRRGRPDRARRERRNYVITGPAALDMTEVAQVMTDVLGRPITYNDMPEDQFKQMLLQQGKRSDEEIEFGVMVHFRAWKRGAADVVTDTYTELTGKPATTVAQWVAAHADAFAAPNVPVQGT